MFRNHFVQVIREHLQNNKNTQVTNYTVAFEYLKRAHHCTYSKKITTKYQIMNKHYRRIKTLLGHTVFWFFYLIATEFQAYDQVSPQFNFQLLIRLSLVHLIILIILVYTNVLWLIPQFLYKKRVLTYILLLATLVLAFEYIDLYVHPFILTPELVKLLHIPESELVDTSNQLLLWSTLQSFIYRLSSVVGISSIWIIFDSFKTKAQLREVEKNQLETQLNMLKAQINPHFLFNVLNSAHFLIPSQPDTASEVLGKLSEMLQYQLYKVKKDKVGLQEELSQIKRYIELEALRREDTLSLETNLDSITENPWIEPFMLLPLVENAFKHSRSIHKDYINIHCTLAEQQLTLKIQNSVPEEQTTTQGGIGIQNLTKRLELLYPGNYEYHYGLDAGMYTALLTLNL